MEIVSIKVENLITDKEGPECDYENESGSSDFKNQNRLSRKRELTMLMELPKRQRKTELNMFGAQFDSFEKLYADEIAGTSKLSRGLHLNIDYKYRLNIVDGEIPEKNHMIQLRWRDLLSCGACKITFININDLLDHAEDKHHSRAKIFHCQSCSSEGEFKALNESILINHLVERHYYEHLKFCCLVCSKIFYDFCSLVNHYKLHKDGKFKILVCLICGWYAKTLEDLKEHKAFHVLSEKSENQTLCSKVFEKFLYGQEPTAHIDSITDHEKNPDGSVTSECQSRFLIDWSFGKYDCPTCVVIFSSPFELFVHQRLKHSKEIDKKVYLCSLCNDKKEFSNLFTFVNHATGKHLDTYNAKFTCVVCSKLFWNYLFLAVHYKTVHPIFSCVLCCHCGKIFPNVTVASSHFKALNLLKTPEERKLLKEGKIEDETRHICHVCARNFKSRGTLLNHVKTHETLEPSELLQCHICKKL